MSNGSGPLTLDEIADALVPFDVRLAAPKLEAIARYVELLIRWNRLVSLTSIDDPTELVSRHFGESIFASKAISLSFGRLADVGTGAGFPGLPLKIAFPELQITLVEPNQKKCAFLTEVCCDLGLEGVTILKTTYEEVPSPSFDFVCSRALGNYRRLLRWSRTALDCSGCVLLWVGTEDSILLTRTAGWTWELPTAIPGSQRRVLLLGRPKDVPRGTPR